MCLLHWQAILLALEPIVREVLAYGFNLGSLRSSLNPHKNGVQNCVLGALGDMDLSFHEILKTVTQCSPLYVNKTPKGK